MPLNCEQKRLAFRLGPLESLDRSVVCARRCDERFGQTIDGLMMRAVHFGPLSGCRLRDNGTGNRRDLVLRVFAAGVLDVVACGCDVGDQRSTEVHVEQLFPTTDAENRQLARASDLAQSELMIVARQLDALATTEFVIFSEARRRDITTTGKNNAVDGRRLFGTRRKINDLDIESEPRSCTLRRLDVARIRAALRRVANPYANRNHIGNSSFLPSLDVCLVLILELTG